MFMTCRNRKHTHGGYEYRCDLAKWQSILAMNNGHVVVNLDTIGEF